MRPWVSLGGRGTSILGTALLSLLENYLQTQKVITTTFESCQVKRAFTGGFCLVYSQFTPALTFFSVKLKPRKMETSLQSCS